MAHQAKFNWTFRFAALFLCLVALAVLTLLHARPLEAQTTAQRQLACTMAIPSELVELPAPSQVLFFNGCDEDVSATWFLKGGAARHAKLKGGEVAKTAIAANDFDFVVSCTSDQQYDRLLKACGPAIEAEAGQLEAFDFWPTGSDWGPVIVQWRLPLFLPEAQVQLLQTKTRVSIVECAVLVGTDKKTKASKCTGDNATLKKTTEKWYVRKKVGNLIQSEITREKWVPTPTVVWVANENMSTRTVKVESPLGAVIINGMRIDR